MTIHTADCYERNVFGPGANVPPHYICTCGAAERLAESLHTAAVAVRDREDEARHAVQDLDALQVRLDAALVVVDAARRAMQTRSDGEYATKRRLSDDFTELDHAVAEYDAFLATLPDAKEIK